MIVGSYESIIFYTNYEKPPLCNKLEYINFKLLALYSFVLNECIFS